MEKIKSFAKDPAKRLWRAKQVDFVRKHFSPNQLRNFNVLALTGPEMLDVYEVFDPLGIKRKNITSVEEGDLEYRLLKEHNDSLGKERINIVHDSLLNYIRNGRINQTYDLVILDYCGYFDKDKNDILHYLALRGWLGGKPILITNYLMQRENQEVKTDLKYVHILNTFAKEKNFSVSFNDVIDLYKLGCDTEAVKNTTDKSFSLTGTRDLKIRQSPFYHMLKGTGFWNTQIFDEFVKVIPHKYGDLSTFLSDAANAANKNEPLCDYLILSCLVEHMGYDTFLFLYYFMNKQTRRHLEERHESYKYVSDSNQPFISDFFFLKKLMPFYHDICS